MTTENNIPTDEEIEQFLSLKNKIEKYEAQIFEEQNKINEQMLQEIMHSGIVPHQLHINVTTDVYQLQSSDKIAPVLLEQFSQNYIIDFIDDSYKELVESLYNNMTKTLEIGCQNIGKKDSDTDNIDEVSV